MEPWHYGTQLIQSIDDIKKYEPRVFGFVYFLSLYDKSGKLKYQYIGKKNLYTVRTKYLTQTEVNAAVKKSDLKRKKTKNGWKYYKTIITESDWIKYCSSNDFIKKNQSKFRIERKILSFWTNDSDLTLQEATEILCQGALNDPTFLNDSVSIRRFGSKLIR